MEVVAGGRVRDKRIKDGGAVGQAGGKGDGDRIPPHQRQFYPERIPPQRAGGFYRRSPHRRADECGVWAAAGREQNEGAVEPGVLATEGDRRDGVAKRLQRVHGGFAGDDAARQARRDDRRIGHKHERAQGGEGRWIGADEPHPRPQPLPRRWREERLARKPMGLAIRTPGVVADLFLDDVAAVAGLGRLVGSLGHFFAVGEEVALDGLEAIAGLGFHFDASSGGQVGVPFDEAHAAGAAEENILGLQLDLRGIALAVKDEELGGAVELLRLGHAPQQQPQGARLKLKVEQVAPFVGY